MANTHQVPQRLKFFRWKGNCSHLKFVNMETPRHGSPGLELFRTKSLSSSVNTYELKRSNSAFLQGTTAMAIEANGGAKRFMREGKHYPPLLKVAKMWKKGTRCRREPEKGKLAKYLLDKMMARKAHDFTQTVRANEIPSKNNEISVDRALSDLNQLIVFVDEPRTPHKRTHCGLKMHPALNNHLLLGNEKIEGLVRFWNAVKKCIDEVTTPELRKSAEILCYSLLFVACLRTLKYTFREFQSPQMSRTLTVVHPDI